MEKISDLGLVVLETSLSSVLYLDLEMFVDLTHLPKSSLDMDDRLAQLFVLLL